MTCLTGVTESSRHVIRVCGFRKIQGMALVAIRIRQFVVGVGMTRLTRRRYVLPREGELGRAMIERRGQPGRCRVTGLAPVIQQPSNMVRVGRLLVVSLMTRVTISIDQLVIVVDVALHALRGDMTARQCEFCRVVIKRCRLPRRRRVTLDARLWIGECHVIRVRRAGEIGSMTIYAIRWKAGVLIVLVAIFARDGPVCPRQGKLRRPVIEGGRSPDSRGMTCLTLVTETRKHVRRTRRLGVVGLVTLVAIGVGQFVVAIDVARLTKRSRMLSRQTEFCCTMVE
jgi:hypothetical protein